MTRGTVYTPASWADWAVEHFNIAEKWLNGGFLLDPGCGRGALSEAVIRKALASGRRPDEADLVRLMGMDRDAEALEAYRREVGKRYGMALPPDSTREADYILQAPPCKADIVFSNPPWVTFADLDNQDKEVYKPYFRSSGLTPDARDLLLGGSRIDLAALFVATALDRDLADGGEAYFFLPMSLFRNEGAHKAFRRLTLPGGRTFALTEVRELEGGMPFPGAGTRYGFASYRCEVKQTWPIPWYRAQHDGDWEEMEASPLDDDGAPLFPVPPGTPPLRPPKIHVPEGSIPRQGVNTGGASDVFIVSRTGKPGGTGVPVVNKAGMHGRLPEILLHPLMEASSFNNTGRPPGEPVRWILLPYRNDGRILSRDELSAYPDALSWLETYREKLRSRKGTFLKRNAEKGLWWSLLGVGPYTFAPWKLGWESYGRNRFVPRIFEAGSWGHWQGNQALHAYIPFWDRSAAEAACSAMRAPELEDYLRGLGGANTKGWAQPGRIRRLLAETDQ